MIALAALVFPFQGADATVHLCEEIHNAAVNVPRSMLASVAVDGITALAFVVVAMFSYVTFDFGTEVANRTGYPFLYYYQQAVGNTGGAIAMATIVLIAIIASAVSVATAESRLLWSLARDRILPFSDYLAKIDLRSLNPVNAVIAANAITLLISLINLGSSSVLSRIFALSTAGFYSTYLACAGLLLWHRFRGTIKEPRGEDTSSVLTVGPDGKYEIKLIWGPWKLEGWWGLSVNIVACAYLTIIIFFSVWPDARAPNSEQMNYSIFVLSAVVLISWLYYHFVARKRYTGPVVEIVL